MVASTTAWASALARQLGPSGFDFERIRTTLVELSGVLAARLAVVPHTGSWLSSVRLSPIALGMASPDIQTGVLEPIISRLRMAGSSPVERDHMAPASFALLSASGVAGVVASAEATVTAGEAEMKILIFYAGRRPVQGLAQNTLPTTRLTKPSLVAPGLPVPVTRA